MAEPVFGGLLEIRIDRELNAAAFLRLVSHIHVPDFAAEAVDLDEAIAVPPHQHWVERLLDTRLPDDGTGFQPLVLRTSELRLRHLTDVTE
jgi:hypothetical protein